MTLLDDLEKLRLEAAASFGSAEDAAALEASRVLYLGTRGRLKELLAKMREVPQDQKPMVGKRANGIATEIQGLFNAAKSRIDASKPAYSLDALKDERIAKLRLYEEKMGKGSAWGAKFPENPLGRLSSLGTIREAFGEMDPEKDLDPQATMKVVHLAARVTLRRDQSKKLIFLTVQDQGGTMQVALWNALLNEDTLALFRDTLDLWDIVGIRGRLAFTKSGEPTVWATEARILSKCIMPPPDKVHGVQDKETRYRQRHLDLLTNPGSRETFILRAKAISGIRRFLDERGFLEMDTPVLQTTPSGAAAKPFETKLNALDMDMFLRIATEIPLKKLLVGGFEKVYEIGRIFRNEGIDSRHNPEFTSVEAYQAYGDLGDMMTLTEGLVWKLACELHVVSLAESDPRTIPWHGKQVSLMPPWPRLEYVDLLLTHAGVTPSDEKGMDEKLLAKKINPAGLSLVDKTDAVFGAYVEEHLWDACFVVNQPIEMSPLCRRHPGTGLADRFEAFACGMEIANAYSELNDPIEQRTRLVEQAKGGPVDEDFLGALGYGMPPAGGLGIGIDRLVMLLANADSIRDVILFPLMRPEQPDVPHQP